MFKQGERLPIDRLQAEVDALKKRNLRLQSRLNNSYTKDLTATKADVAALQASVGAQIAALTSALSAKANTSALASYATTTALSAGSAAIPALSSVVPMSESKTGAAGTGTTVPRADHQHPRLSSSTTGTTDASGLATVTFTRAFAAAPAMAIFAVENNNSPSPTFKVKSWVMTGADITGCVLYGSRARVLPTLTSVSGILTAVITGVNAIVSALSGYAPYEPAANVSFTCIAVQSSAT